jgi:hypothetical protein
VFVRNAETQSRRVVRRRVVHRRRHLRSPIGASALPGGHTGAPRLAMDVRRGGRHLRGGRSRGLRVA